jgi:hypothetical protein
MALFPVGREASRLGSGALGYQFDTHPSQDPRHEARQHLGEAARHPVAGDRVPIDLGAQGLVKVEHRLGDDLQENLRPLEMRGQRQRA